MGNESALVTLSTLRSINVLRGRCESEPAVIVRERLATGADPVKIRNRR